MNGTSYNIKELAKANAISSAGYVGYQMGRELVQSFFDRTKPGYKNVKFYEANENEAGGLFGLPTFDIIHFGTMDKKNPVQWLRLLRKEEMPEVTLQCVVMTIRSSKTVVKTEVMGQRKTGSVKEFMGYNDYQVNITGVLFGTGAERNKYPMKQYNDLRRVCEAPIAIPVVNDRLNRAGIMNLVIEDFGFPAMPGNENVQPFELACCSDEPFELKIKNRSDVLRQERIGADSF